jgi:phosphoribosylaminoimidazole carboxylase PurE protein
MSDKNPLVGVVMGSKSDADVMKVCLEQLEALNIPHEVKVISAHRTPDQTREFAEKASGRGLEIIIAGAGWSAHLAGVIAAHTLLPVIGVPIDSSSLQGMDALLSTVQMPAGIPVATVAIGRGGAKNAAILAGQILALKHPEIATALKSYRKNLTKKTIEEAESWKP